MDNVYSTFAWESSDLASPLKTLTTSKKLKCQKIQKQGGTTDLESAVSPRLKYVAFCLLLLSEAWIRNMPKIGRNDHSKIAASDTQTLVHLAEHN